MRAMPPTCRHRRTDAIALGNPQGQFRDRKPRFRRLIAKSSMSFEPDRRKSRKSTFLHLQVSQTLSKTRVSRRLFSVVSPVYHAAKQRECLHGVLRIIVVPWDIVEIQKSKHLIAIFLQALDELACGFDRHHRRRDLYKIDQQNSETCSGSAS